MKITLTDKLHISICLNIFIIVWRGLESIDPSINGAWFAFTATLGVSIFKELNDWKGWFPFLLTDGKTKTGFSGRDIIVGNILPTVLMIIIYNL